MNRAFYLLVFLLTPLFSQGQNSRLYPVQTRQDSIRFTVIEESGKLGISFFKKPINNAFPQIRNISIIGSDLLVDYYYKGNKNKFSSDAIKLIGIAAPNNDVIEPIVGQLIHTKEKTAKQKEFQGYFNWIDATEQTLDLGSAYTLILERSIMEKIDCENGVPTFSLGQRLPCYTTAGIGIIALGIGQLYRGQRDQAYADYRNDWIEGASQSNRFNEAEDKADKARTWTYVGAGLLSVSSFGFLYRQIKFKRKHRLYEKHCTEKELTTLQINPIIEMPVLDKMGMGAYSGVQFIWQF